MARKRKRKRKRKPLDPLPTIHTIVCEKCQLRINPLDVPMFATRCAFCWREENLIPMWRAWWQEQFTALISFSRDDADEWIAHRDKITSKTIKVIINYHRDEWKDGLPAIEKALTQVNTPWKPEEKKILRTWQQTIIDSLNEALHPQDTKQLKLFGG